MGSMWSRAKRAVEYCKVFSDLDSVQRFRRLCNAPSKPDLDSKFSRFRLRALNGNYAVCRTGGSDLNVFADVFFKKYHLPPPDLIPIRRILDLGSNIGLTIAHFASLFPQAKILGIELDAENTELCLLNIRPYADRCRVICGAVWNEPGRVGYGGDKAWGFRITSADCAQHFVDSYTLPSLIQQLGAPVDYVKMDIEGAESALLKQAQLWMQDVRCIKIEVHEPYSLEDCVEDLKRGGFRVVIDTHRSKCVIAYNEALHRK